MFHILVHAHVPVSKKKKVQVQVSIFKTPINDQCVLMQSVLIVASHHPRHFKSLNYP